MLVSVFTIILIFSLAHCNAENEIPDNKLLGIKTLHTKIDKDTIITRNMKPEKRKRERKGQIQDSNDPDWSYSSFPKDVTDHVEQFKRNMSECLKEVQANDKRTVKPLSPKRESPVHGECLIACVLKRNGVIEKGKIRRDNLILLVNKFFAKDEKLMKKLEKNLDRCIDISTRNKDECALAAQLNECTNDIMAHNKNKLIVNY